MKVAERYGDKITVPRVKLGHGIVGYAALHKVAVNVPDVSIDPRYIKVVDDARSELVIPLMLQDRCVGVFDLEPRLDAFTKSHVDILTLLASQAAVAIENAQLYERIRSTKGELEKGNPLRAAGQAGLLPMELPKRMKGIDVAARLQAGARARRRLHDFAPEPNSWSMRGRRRRARAWRPRSTAPSRRAGALAYVSPPLCARALPPAGVLTSSSDPLRAPARGSLLHAVLRAVRHQTADRDARQLGAASTRCACSGTPSARWRSRACRSACLPGRPTDESLSTSCRATSHLLLDGVYDANDFGAATSSAWSGCSRS
jgi:hypothetical protein